MFGAVAHPDQHAAEDVWSGARMGQGRERLGSISFVTGRGVRARHESLADDYAEVFETNS